MKKRFKSQDNTGFSFGFATGAVFGVVAGLLWTHMNKQENNWEPLLETKSPASEEGEQAESIRSHPPKRRIKSATVSTGASDASAGRIGSNIDDLPDRG
jgi:hypothetical protein